MTFIFYPGQSESTAQLGGKAGALAALAQTELPIPAWFVLSPEAFYASLDQSQRDALAAATDSAEILAVLKDFEPDPAVQTELTQALAKLCPNGEPVAVRSSALDEDGVEHSFAGQLDSFLFVPLEEVASRVVAIWRSGFSERVLAYRREHRLAWPPSPPAVLIQRMVKAEVSGVAFSADPVSGRREVAVVAAVYGLGTALVSGDSDADTYHVDPAGRILWRQIAEKQTAHRYRGEGLWINDSSGTSDEGRRTKDERSRGDFLQPKGIDQASVNGRRADVRAVTPPGDQASRPALSEAQVQAVADLARRAEQIFGCPQDIEWTIEAGQLYLLQARPITSLAPVAGPEGVLNLWDNSNIAESYPGLTTPLTFSFARRAYEEVYRQFCRMMGVPAATIAAHQHTFGRMLGYIRGRIYYNLLSWYRVLALLPGYKLNRRFMEQMMGVDEKLPDELLADPTTPDWRARWFDGWRLARTILGLIANYFLLPRRIDSFYRRLDAALGTTRPDLDSLRPDELATYYRDLERQLLTRWDAPLINDFFAMIFYGLLRKLSETWCDSDSSLANKLLAGTGGMISAEPAARLREMAQTVAEDSDLVAALCEGSLPQILAQMEKQPQLMTLYRAYLDKFGERCLEELKLESPTLHDDPLLLLRSVGQLARQLSLKAAPPNSAGQTALAQAEQQVRAALAGRPLRRLIFNWVLGNARRRVRDRENLRFERTRVFGRVRLISLALGRRFEALDLLDQARDIFYLEVAEVLGFIEGTTTTTDLKGLVAVRKAEFERHRRLESPADRFETRGMVHHGNSFQGQVTMQEEDGDRRQGLGCCAGIVCGPVRVVTHPQQARLQPGDILVAKRTDPGWIMLFPSAAGLLVEHGSLLSHSAIVARELGLPAIVSLKDATRWLKDGDWVEFDGSSGLVRKIERGA